MPPPRAVLVCLDESEASPRVLSWALSLVAPAEGAQPISPPTVLYLARVAVSEVPYDLALDGGPEFVAVSGSRDIRAADAEAVSVAKDALEVCAGTGGAAAERRGHTACLF